MSILNYPLFDLLKVMFPSWEFFDKNDYKIVLKYKYAESNQSIARNDWRIVNYKNKRKVKNFIINEENNILLAIESNIQLFINSINNSININENKISDNINDNINENIYYKIIENYVKGEIINLGNKELKYYQFKISFYDMYSNNQEKEKDIFISQLLRLK